MRESQIQTANGEQYDVPGVARQLAAEITLETGRLPTGEEVGSIVHPYGKIQLRYPSVWQDDREAINEIVNELRDRLDDINILIDELDGFDEVYNKDIEWSHHHDCPIDELPSYGDLFIDSKSEQLRREFREAYGDELLDRLESATTGFVITVTRKNPGDDDE